jgi:hypothetical protein
MKILILSFAFLIFCLGFIVGGNGHVIVVKDDGTVCAEVK